MRLHSPRFSVETTKKMLLEKYVLALTDSTAKANTSWTKAKPNWKSFGYATERNTSIWDPNLDAGQISLGMFIQTSTLGDAAYTCDGVEGKVLGLSFTAGSLGFLRTRLPEEKLQALLDRLFPYPADWRKVAELYSQNGKSALVIWEGVPAKPDKFAVVGHTITIHQNADGMSSPGKPQNDKCTPRCVPMCLIKKASSRAAFPNFGSQRPSPIWTSGDKSLYCNRYGFMIAGGHEPALGNALVEGSMNIRDVMKRTLDEGASFFEGM